MLLSLVERGLTREDAYALVQRNAMSAWDEGGPCARCWRTTRRWPRRLPAAELDALFDPAWYTRHVREVMERVAAL